MSNPSMTPGSRPRKGVIGVCALIGAGILATAVAIGVGETATTPRVAAAVDLARFSSCDDLAAWGEEAMTAGGSVMALEDGDFSVAEAAPAPAAADGAEGTAGTTAASDGAGDAGRNAAGTEQPDADEATSGEAGSVDDTTNVAVEGVDEIDLVDRLSEDVVLVASAATLAVVDVVAAEVVTSVAVPYDAQITYDAEAGVAWVVGHPDAGGVVVERYAVDTATLELEGRWTTSGYLVDARRVGDELHVVASDGFSVSDGGVPLPAPEPEGDIEPPAGVDGGSASSDGAAAVVPFAGGPVPCEEVLHPTGPSDPSATLVVTLPAVGAVEPVRATEVVGSGQLVHVTTGAIYLATPRWDGGEPTTGIHRFDLATLTPTGSGTVEGTLLDDFSMSERDGVLRVAVTAQPAVPFEAMPIEPGIGGPDVGVASDDVQAPAPPIAGGGALNEIVVLDTEGTLDVVGRTERFGKPGETLHGIRFAGATAYAVTFLQTDPFYVVDLSDPTAPAVVGEVELPGFSSYLHPLGDGLVVGFGPGEDGAASAKLFDVSDPTAPAVVGDLRLGDDAAVAYDHHAYVDLGDGRFAVPVTGYGGGSQGGPAVDDMVEPGPTTLTGAVLVVDTAGGALVEVDRLTVPVAEPASRAIIAGDGWALLAGAQITLVDASGQATATLTL